MSIGTQAAVTYLAGDHGSAPNYWIAIIGLAGVIAGACVSVAGAAA